MSLSIETTSATNLNPTEYQRRQSKKSLTEVCQYQPLIQFDPIIREPIDAWQRRLLRNLGTIVGCDESDIGYIFNQLALIEAYKGNYPHALTFCELQISYWNNLAKHEGNQSCLVNVIQPWVNTFRLARWQNKQAAALQNYRQLDPDNRGLENTLGSRFGPHQTLSGLLNLSADTEWEDVIDTIFWCEYGNLLLSSGEHAGFMAHVRRGLASAISAPVKMRLLELWFKALSQNKEYTHALTSLQQMKLTKKGKYSFHFSILEMVLLFNLGDERANILADKLYGAIIDGEIDLNTEQGLYLLFGICNVYLVVGYDYQKVALFKLLMHAARTLNDEVLLFTARDILCSIGHYERDAIEAEFAKSQYSVVRSNLKTNKFSIAEDDKANEIERCLAYLSELDFANSKKQLEKLNAR